MGKRHPTLGNNVLVGSGAKVLGPFKVGDNARIAAGAVVLSEVPANGTAVGVPARVVKVNGIRSETLDQIHVSDPVALALCNLEHKISLLQKEIDDLKNSQNKGVVKMILYNSLGQTKQEFVPHTPGKVNMYTCGPTVYHYAHIGNLRTYIMEDVLEKYLRFWDMM